MVSGGMIYRRDESLEDAGSKVVSDETVSVIYDGKCSVTPDITKRSLL